MTVLDAGNNIVTSYTGTVHFTSSDLAADLPTNYTFTTGLGQDNGVHPFNATFHTAATQSITATSTLTAVTGTQSGIVVGPGAATQFLVDGFPVSTTAGAPHNVTVTALDADGNTATDYVGTVAITSTDGAAVLPSSHTFTGGEAGVHDFAVTLETSAGGTKTITATDTVTTSITGAQSGITVNASTATHFAVTGFNPSPVAGASDGFSVTALDGLNNIATGYVGTVHITSSDIAGTFSADAGLTNGVGAFTGTLRTVGPQSITATDTIAPGINGHRERHHRHAGSGEPPGRLRIPGLNCGGCRSQRDCHGDGSVRQHRYELRRSGHRRRDRWGHPCRLRWRLR